MPGSACSSVGVGIAGDRFLAHRRPPRARRGHLDADLLGPGQKDIVGRDGDLFEAGALEMRPRVHSASSRSRAEPAMCGWRSETRCASRMRSADGSERKRRSTLALRRASERVKPKEPACGRCQAAVSSAVAATASATPTRIALVTSSDPLRMLVAAFWPDPAGDPATRMCARAAQVESRDRRAVLGAAEDRPHREELIERWLAVQDVAPGQPVGRLEIARRDDLLMDDEPFDTRRVLATACAGRSARDRRAASDQVRPPASV